MRPARRAAFGGWALALAAGSSLSSQPLLAQEADEPPPDLMRSEPADLLAKEPPPAPVAEPAPLAPPTRQAPAAIDAVGLELLGPEAFGSRQPRGIPGGSLVWTSHGLQWPYLPARPGQARTRLGFSGLGWVDTSYRAVDGGSPSDPDRAEWEQRGRFVLRATPTYNAPGAWFVQAHGELVLLGVTPATPEESLGVDDLYVRVGKWRAFDLTVGRFQGWEVYHLGLGLDLYTTERRGASTAQNPALDIGSDLQFLWDRRAGRGNVALHVYPLEILRFELLGAVGSSPLGNTLGVRPAGILDFGILKAKIAADYERESPQEQLPELEARTIRRGVVGALQVVMEPFVEAGVAGGYALVDNYDAQGELNAAGSNTTYSFGGFANAQLGQLVLGAGGAYTHQRNLEADPTGTLNDLQAHTQVFGAAQYVLWQQLYVKLVVAYGRALFDPQSQPMPDTFRNESLSGRLRLSYAF